MTEETSATTARASEPELDVGPPDAPDVHVTPQPSALAQPQQLPPFTRWLLAGLAIAVALLAAAYAP